jgi:hypothetical protein
MRELPKSRQLPEIRIPVLRADTQHTRSIANTRNAIP